MCLAQRPQRSGASKALTAASRSILNVKALRKCEDHYTKSQKANIGVEL